VEASIYEEKPLVCHRSQLNQKRNYLSSVLENFGVKDPHKSPLYMETFSHKRYTSVMRPSNIREFSNVLEQRSHFSKDSADALLTFNNIELPHVKHSHLTRNYQILR